MSNPKYWTAMGEYYGYSQCCIDEFLKEEGRDVYCHTTIRGYLLCKACNVEHTENKRWFMTKLFFRRWMLPPYISPNRKYWLGSTYNWLFFKDHPVLLKRWIKKMKKMSK